MDVKNVLVYPCGTDAGLELNIALGQMIHYRLFGIGRHDPDRGEHVYRNYLGSLMPDQPDFLSRLSRIIEDYQIDFIYPASFEALLVLTRHRDLLQAEVVAPSHEAAAACVSRQSAATALQGEVVFAEHAGSNQREWIAVCFTNRQGILNFAKSVEENKGIIKEIAWHEAGEEWLGRTARCINDRLQMRGAWTFRYTALDHAEGKEMRLLDIVPGYSAVMALYRNQGVNLATLSLFDRMGHDIKISPQLLPVEAAEHKTKRYRIDLDYDDVYVDLDDTILVNHKVNPLMVAFLFQCRNQGKKIHLITKHRHNLYETLDKHRLQALFDHIIWLKSDDHKSLHMKSERAIFIDDAFSERKQVSDRLGIPTFEVSAVESLMDWRL